MKKKILIGTVIAMAVVVATCNFVFVKNSNCTIAELTLFNAEALADVEWNDWNQWFTQGLTKDEREVARPCPSDQSSSGNGSVSIGSNSASGGGSHSQTNPSGRYDIDCAYGNENCSSVDC